MVCLTSTKDPVNLSPLYSTVIFSSSVTGISSSIPLKFFVYDTVNGQLARLRPLLVGLRCILDNKHRIAVLVLQVSNTLSHLLIFHSAFAPQRPYQKTVPNGRFAKDVGNSTTHSGTSQIHTPWPHPLPYPALPE